MNKQGDIKTTTGTIVIKVNGENKTLNTHEDIAQLIADTYGMELGKYVFNAMREVDAEVEYARERVSSDCDSLMEENGYLSSSLRELKDTTEKLREYIEESPRLSRKELMEYVTTLDNENVVDGW